MNPNLPSIQVLGVRVAQLSREAALAELGRLHDAPEPAAVAFVNAHTLNVAAADADFRAVLNRLALVLNDGSGLSLAAKLQRRPFPENLNGTDLTPQVLALAAERSWGVFLLGAKPGIAERASEALRARHPGLQVRGTRDGYFRADQMEEVLAQIRGSGASVLIVALGNPLQEKWLDRHLEASGCSLGLGVGAFLDFAAGNVPRAPMWMRRVGVEWAYRLAQEPGRMWRRYVLGNPLFLARVLKEAHRGGGERGR